MTALLSVRDLHVEAAMHRGAHVPVVKGVSFDVARREVVALIGESGSGKTTTCLAAVGYARSGCRIAAGSVSLDGTNILLLDHGERRRLRGARVAYVAQSAAAAFNPALTIGAQVIEASRVHRIMPPHEARRRAIALYEQLDLPEPERIGSRYPHQVSGGQLQRLMAVMAVNCGPELLLLDEPTTALDVTTQIEVLRTFKEIIRRQEAAAIYVSHDLAVVAQIADRVIVMFNGAIVEEGATEQIISAPTHEYTRRLIAAVRPPPSVALGRQAALARRADRSPLLELRGISASYANTGGKRVLRDIDIVLERGTTVGVIGESGSGKSTLARVIAGLMPPLAGRVIFEGAALAPSVRRRKRTELRRIQIVFQMADVALNPRHRVVELLRRPLALFTDLDAAQTQRRIDDMLERVELPAAVAYRYPHELSGGQKQRVNLARALIVEPDAILCDEITSSLDTLVATAVIESLKRLKHELGLTCLFISHDISTIASFADWIVVLHSGLVVEQGPLRSVLDAPHHPYTRLLLSSIPELRKGWLEEDTLPFTPRPAAVTGKAEDGCPFYARCPMAISGRCDKEPPPVHVLERNHRIRCHRDPAELAQDHANRGATLSAPAIRTLRME